MRVDADGDIRLPMLKDPILVKGHGSIAGGGGGGQSSLNKGNVLVDPVVTVTIVEYQSRPVNVVGAVKNPLVFQATRPIPLLDAIARAGGMTEDAGLGYCGQQAGDARMASWSRTTQSIPVRKLIDNADPIAERDAARRRGSAGSRSA